MEGRPARAALVRARQAARAGWRPVRIELDRLAARGRADLAVFHDFLPAPTGGGSQFLRALVRELERRGLDVEVNRLSRGTTACLFNSFNFDFRRLRRFARRDCRFVHRVDGPVGVYRGVDDGTDRRILAVNAELADATVLQSRYSLEMHRDLGLELRDPVVIHNTVDPAIFHPPARREPLAGRRVRIAATSWSDNPRKGAATLAWLDRHLDRDRYELTFAGRAPVELENARVVGPLGSHEVAELLRSQDVYLAPNLHDACSNALLEGLACGLPALFAASGGHPELVGEAGLPFTDEAELPGALDRLTADLERFRAAISVTPLAEVADRYLAVLGIG
jgi:glycosyltransferase involved in cell wall biosynthesis